MFHTAGAERKTEDCDDKHVVQIHLKHAQLHCRPRTMVAMKDA